VRRTDASIALFLVLGLGLVSGCGGGSSAKPAEQVLVKEHDFHISAPTVLQAGRVDLTVDNRGPAAHELIVVRGRPENLPMRTDGLTIDEDAIKSSEAGALEPANPGASRDLDVDLKPGRYVMFCNMYGHYESGMHTDLVVR
jgi:uncharacterized cupredoxin-like copper-binding protein